MKVIKIYILILSFLVISTQVDQELLNCSYQPKDSCKNYAITPEKGVECWKITVVNLRALNTKYSIRLNVIFLVIKFYPKLK